MNPILSRRVARVMATTPVVGLPDKEYLQLPETVERAKSWDELPDWLRSAVEAGEAELSRKERS